MQDRQRSCVKRFNKCSRPTGNVEPREGFSSIRKTHPMTELGWAVGINESESLINVVKLNRIMCVSKGS